MFSLVWTDSAFDEMQEIISRNLSSARWISGMLDLLRSLLENIPEALGESREPGDRLCCVGPHVVSYHVDSVKRSVVNNSTRER